MTEVIRSLCLRRNVRDPQFKRLFRSLIRADIAAVRAARATGRRI